MKKQSGFIYLVILFTCLVTLNCNAAESEQTNRFVTNKDNTVLDTKTGLMWAAKDNEVDTNWDAAKLFCDNYSAGNHTDWRLPTLQELATIFDATSTKRFKSYDQITLSGCCPWTSDTRRQRARTIFFIVGEANTFSKKLSTNFRALPVRKAK